ncbi:MAG: ABC transporter substrate-binding protein [Chloroflexi bacterium]|nr:ABC transporter substrate-binding protein [Chloroflexota bacterium]
MKSRWMLIVVLCLSLTAVLVPPTTAQGPETNIIAGCVENYDPNVDYFPQKATVKVSDGFSVEYFSNYKVVTVNEPWTDGVPIEYVLVQCGTPAPEMEDGANVIEVPRTTLVSMSTTYLPFIVELGLLDNLVGLDAPDYVSTPEVREKIDAGELVTIGSGAEVNVEAVLDLDPSLIMTYGSGSPDYDAHPVLIEAGLPVVLNAEYMDTSPLGRAEWLKFIALFFNLEAEGETLFDDIAAQYNELTAMTADLEERPTVFTNTPYDGTWYMPGGNSFVAKLLADAGADYLWSDDESTGSLYLDFETVFERAADADFWVNAGGFWFSLDDALAEDERFEQFAAFQNGNVWSNNLALNEFGGNDYWEGGVANPQLVLADLIAIFHPDLLPDHEFVYYQQLQ